MNQELYPQMPILLVDDEEAWLRSLSIFLREATGMNNFIKCTDSRNVMEILANRDICLVLLDLTMPYFSGQDILRMIVSRHPSVPVIILSGLNQVETAVECLHLGALDYHVKTHEKERLIAGIQRAITTHELRRENARLKKVILNDELENPEAFEQIISTSKKMQAVYRYCEAISRSSEPILITGESGSGKELIARALWKLRSPKAPFVAVNVAGLDDNVFSDTLFGHVAGAFTGADRDRKGMIEEAAGGTLFLDEIGDLSPPSQIKLLRILQEGEFFPIGADRPKKLKARVLLATNHNLVAKVSRGEFRKDLYYRLNTHQIQLPSLRERLEDLPLLLHHFLDEAARTLEKKTSMVPKDLVALLSTYPFPGNIRELRAMVFHAVSLTGSQVLSLESFKEKMEYGAEGFATMPTPGAAPEGIALIPFPDRLPTIDEIGKRVVMEAIHRTGGNQTVAASMLGITRQALAKRLKKLPGYPLNGLPSLLRSTS
ncbi:MAG: two-component system response regulator [Desulfuromonadales bacterium GWD2_61_12]|nr:MAG: two-component system response regulator [Desulfuromonadales bacterium GWC2_61_20]OGR34489.1 MAG: two-component system response regulator [Desulfuromonadales bacterium GWD2_61_12]HBT83141.1 two-component system response regulator [Desulfuromonas sp.]